MKVKNINVNSLDWFLLLKNYLDHKLTGHSLPYLTGARAMRLKMRYPTIDLAKGILEEMLYYLGSEFLILIQYCKYLKAPVFNLLKKEYVIYHKNEVIYKPKSDVPAIVFTEEIGVKYGKEFPHLFDLLLRESTDAIETSKCSRLLDNISKKMIWSEFSQTEAKRIKSILKITS